jgi:hypothetical protein
VLSRTPSNNTLKVQKSDDLEFLEVLKEDENTNNKTKTPFEDSSKTPDPEIAEKLDAEGGGTKRM